MNLFTLHAYILYLQLNFLVVVLAISTKILWEPEGQTPRTLLIFSIVISCLALIIWLLCFTLLLLPEQADWLMVAYAEYLYLVNTFLFLFAAVAMSLIRSRLPCA